MFKLYYQLTKPGIIYGNAITATAGFLLASRDRIHPELLIAMLIGLSLVIASGCVFNNIYDRDMDGKMDRTKNRALAAGAISKSNAMLYGVLLIILGALVLSLFTNRYSLVAALTGFIVYVFIYTPLKHKTIHATLIGSVAGATPPVVGYCAAAGRFDAAALIFFLILVFWQMPHFYAIAIRRINDYAKAGIPVLPIKHGIKTTKIHILFYICAFLISAAMLARFGHLGYLYLAAAVGLGFYWLALGIKGLKASDDKLWAKKLFFTSLIVLTSLCVIIPLDILIK